MNKKIMLLAVTLFLIFGSIGVCVHFLKSAKASPTTWTVDNDGPADFHTIQEAINAASPGDTIYVYNGTYYEHVVVNKTVSLIGENRETTIVDGNGTGTVITIVTNNVTVSDFTIQRGGGYFPNAGIFLDTCQNVILTNNVISENDEYGIYLSQSSNNYLAGNIIENNVNHGILAHFSWQNIFNENVITNNEIGIYFLNSYNNTLIRNIISEGDRGIHAFYHSQGNKISENTITNTKLGIELIDGCSYNKIYHNNFVNNTRQAVIVSELTPGLEPSINVWDIGYPSGGNYWSDYTGLDLYGDPHQNLIGDDGVGDTPYVIDEDNLDKYPLMNTCGPTYNVTIRARCNTESMDVSVSIDMDGLPTGYTTPYTFTGLTGNHTFVVSATDLSGHPFKHWNTGETTTNMTVTSGRHIICTAYYQAKYALTVTTTTGGTTSPSPGTHTHWEGTMVSLTAIQDISYLFDHWELDGNSVGANNPISVSVDTDHALHAVFIYWPFHDVAVTNLMPSKTVVGQGYSVTINLSVENQGGFPETFNLTINANTNIIHTLVNITLTSGNFTVFTFPWKTTSVAKDNYTITATADQVLGETDIADNTLTDGWILVTIPGDVNGDRRVDMKDVYAIILCFGSKPWQPKYNPNCDINCDSVIDMKDIYISIFHFNKSW